jgi:hypothetical protein
MLRNVTWQQVILVLGLVVAGILATRFLGSDAGQLVNAILMVLAWFRDPNPPSPPTPPATPNPPNPAASISIIGGLFAVVLLFGCANIPARAPARAALVTTAYAIRVTAEICSEQVDALETAGKSDEAEDFGSRCLAALRMAQKSVLVAADAVDSWSQADSRAAYACAVKDTVAALWTADQLLVQSGVKVPEELVDALELAKVVAGAAGNCEVDAGK